MPVACAAMQLNPGHGLDVHGRSGKAGLGLRGRRMPVPRGKMLGGSSGLNYMAYVRGHPGDFDSWAEGGATGWSYADVLPYFRKSEGLAPCDEIDDRCPGAQQRWSAWGLGALAGARGRARIRRGGRGGRHPARRLQRTRPRWRGGCGVAGANQHAAGQAVEHLSRLPGGRDGRSAEPHDHHRGAGDARGAGRLARTNEAKGVEYRTATGETGVATARKEVILSAGAVGSPHLLLLSGIGPRRELETVGVPCLVDSPHVGKHLKDHIQVPLFFSAPGVGVSMQEVALSMGPAALRHPAGPLPADPEDDGKMPADLQALKQEAERRLAEWATTGCGLVSSSLYDACAWFSTGLGDHHSHDAQIAFFPCGCNYDLWHSCLNVDTAEYFDDASTRLAPDAESMILLANPVLPHSEGEIVLESADPADHPAIRMNYFGDPHDMKVMVAVLRRALEIVAHWPGHRKIGPLMIPPFLAEKHGYREGETPSDALLEDFALHFSLTVYHLTCTCRIGSVVDPRLRVPGLGSCAWRMRASCPTSSAATRTPRRS